MAQANLRPTTGLDTESYGSKFRLHPADEARSLTAGGGHVTADPQFREVLADLYADERHGFTATSEGQSAA
ncbi:hypothetical protein ABCR94_13270 [Streptomyces sp. 21So2-11]|uniref:hypothetical protein n=1 Tax=Streptomyces sp. 21So2-11 TaxID=3144408 RepID=UPI00321B889E